MAKRECIVGVRFDEKELDFLKRKALQETKYCFRTAGRERGVQTSGTGCL